MAYLAGLHSGTYAPDDLTTKTALYDLVKQMVREFTERHGTTSCRELLEMISAADATIRAHGRAA